jgi:hypothetical protein
MARGMQQKFKTVGTAPKSNRACNEEQHLKFLQIVPSRADKFEGASAIRKQSVSRLINLSDESTNLRLIPPPDLAFRAAHARLLSSRVPQRRTACYQWGEISGHW